MKDPFKHGLAGGKLLVTKKWATNNAAGKRPRLIRNLAISDLVQTKINRIVNFTIRPGLIISLLPFIKLFFRLMIWRHRVMQHSRLAIPRRLLICTPRQSNWIHPTMYYTVTAQLLMPRWATTRRHSKMAARRWRLNLIGQRYNFFIYPKPIKIHVGIWWTWYCIALPVKLWMMPGVHVPISSESICLLNNTFYFIF